MESVFPPYGNESGKEEEEEAKSRDKKYWASIPKWNCQKKKMGYGNPVKKYVGRAVIDVLLLLDKGIYFLSLVGPPVRFTAITSSTFFFSETPSPLLKSSKAILPSPSFLPST